MRSFFTTIVVLFTTISLFAQTPVQIMDEKSGTLILVGESDPKMLTEGEFGVSYATEFSNYVVDSILINQLNTILQNDPEIALTIVLATWCGDSKEQVPRFFKIKSLLTSSFSSLKIICVDREKKAGNLDISDLKIEKVPTFIFSEKGIELGRIVETPMKTIENDIIRILSIK